MRVREELARNKRSRAVAAEYARIVKGAHQSPPAVASDVSRFRKLVREFDTARAERAAHGGEKRVTLSLRKR